MKRRLSAVLVAATAVSVILTGCDSTEPPLDTVERYLDDPEAFGPPGATLNPDVADVWDAESRSLIKKGGWADVTIDGVRYHFARSHPESCHPTFGMLSVDLDLVEVDGAPADPNDPGVLIMKLHLPDGDPELSWDNAVWLRIPVDGGRTYAAGEAVPGNPGVVPAVMNFSVEKVTDYPFPGDRNQDGYLVINDPQRLMHAGGYYPDVIVKIELFCAVTEG